MASFLPIPVPFSIHSNSLPLINSTENKQQQTLSSSPITPINLKNTYVGSPAGVISGRKINRTIRKIQLNLTSSESDPLFEQNTIVVTTPQERFAVEDPYKLVKEYGKKGVLMNHLKKRVDIFFQQLVTTYGAGLHYELGPTLEQGESGAALYISDAGIKTKVCTRNAAHSSTLPCLVAYDQNAWNDFVNGKGPKPEGVVFAKDSALFSASNATIVMPRDVNEADMAIDEDLRAAALSIINKASLLLVTPKEGLFEFLHAMDRKINEKVDAVTKPGVKCALEFYKSSAAQIIESSKEFYFFDNLLDVNTEDTSDIEVKEFVHRSRYRAIRRQNLGQTKIVRELRGLKTKITKTIKKTTAFKEESFQELLIKQMPSREDKIRTKKLLNHSHAENLIDNPGSRTRFKNTQKALLQHSTEFTTTANEISSVYEEMREAEVKSRSGITHKLRKAKNWTKEELAKKMNARNPFLLVTSEKVRLWENGTQPITDKLGETLSTVFKVDSTVYSSKSFYS